MLFGKDKKKGIVLRGTQLEVVELGKNGITGEDILVHNMYNPDPGVHIMLSRMTPPAFPAALGVIRSVPESSFDQNMEEVIEQSKRDSKIKNVDDLLRSGNTWKI